MQVFMVLLQYFPLEQGGQEKHICCSFVVKAVPTLKVRTVIVLLEKNYWQWYKVSSIFIITCMEHPA